MVFVLDDIALATAAFAVEGGAAVAAPTAGAIIPAGTAGTVGANLAAIGTVSGIGAQAGQAGSSIQAAKIQSKALELGRKKAKISAARERRRIIREGQLARARTVAQAESAGIEAGSTARVGAIQDIESRVAANVSFLERQTRAGITGSSLLGEASRLQQQAGLFKAGANISNTFLKEIERG